MHRGGNEAPHVDGGGASNGKMRRRFGHRTRPSIDEGAHAALPAGGRRRRHLRVQSSGKGGRARIGAKVGVSKSTRLARGETLSDWLLAQHTRDGIRGGIVASGGRRMGREESSG